VLVAVYQYSRYTELRIIGLAAFKNTVNIVQFQTVAGGTDIGKVIYFLLIHCVKVSAFPARFYYKIQ